MAKSYIVVVGEYTPQLLENKMILQELSKEEVEINIFDFPRLDGKDTVERIDEHTFVHRYANPSSKQSDSVNRTKEYIRDIIALGAYKHYIFKPKSRDFIELYEHLIGLLKVHGVDYKLM